MGILHNYLEMTIFREIHGFPKIFLYLIIVRLRPTDQSRVRLVGIKISIGQFVWKDAVAEGGDNDGVIDDAEKRIKEN